MRRFTEGSESVISQNSGVVCGVPSTPQPARLTSFLTMPPSSLCNLERQVRIDENKLNKWLDKLQRNHTGTEGTFSWGVFFPL